MLLQKSKIHNLCREHGIKNYTINDDISISVDGSVDLAYKNLKSLPIKFKEVSGDFSCSHNQLTSLKYCPETVGGHFSCSDNQLTSLEGCPESVGGDLSCNHNQLTNFDGLPEFCEQDISLIGNPVNEIYKLFKEDHRCIYWIREYDVIMDMTVIRDRLEEVYHTLGMDVPNLFRITLNSDKDISFKEYILIF